MDKFLNYGMYESFLGNVPFRELKQFLRKLIYLDKYKNFTKDPDVILYRSQLNPNNIPSDKSIILLKYIRLGWFSLSDCNWDIDLFHQMGFICDKADFLLYNRCLVKFEEEGMVYNEEIIYNDNEYIKLLVNY